MNWWVANLYQSDQIVALVSWIFWVIFSICLHELAHGWAALWQGDDTPRRLGHMTMNPMVHMGGWSLLMFALVGIAWGAMPVDPSRFRWRRKGRVVVAGAGPALNLGLAFITLTCAALWARYGSHEEPLAANVSVFLITGGWLNLVLALFNLLPIPPLDGSNILMGFSFGYYRLMQSEKTRMIGMLILIAVFFSGVGILMFRAAIHVSTAYIDLLLEILP